MHTCAAEHAAKLGDLLSYFNRTAVRDRVRPKLLPPPPHPHPQLPRCIVGHGDCFFPPFGSCQNSIASYTYVCIHSIIRNYFGSRHFDNHLAPFSAAARGGPSIWCALCCRFEPCHRGVKR